MFACVGRQVTLCDPILQVTPRRALSWSFITSSTVLNLTYYLFTSFFIRSIFDAVSYSTRFIKMNGGKMTTPYILSSSSSSCLFFCFSIIINTIILCCFRMV